MLDCLPSSTGLDRGEFVAHALSGPWLNPEDIASEYLLSVAELQTSYTVDGNESFVLMHELGSVRCRNSSP